MTWAISRNILVVLTTTVAVLLCLSASVLGITTDAYTAKLDRARGLALQLEVSLRNQEVNHQHIRLFSEYIGKNFPSTERVDWPEGSVETSHEWLLEKTAALETQKDIEKRLAAAVEIREYLSTSVFKLQELASLSASERTKDEDKQKLAEILRRQEYQKPEVKQSAFQRWLTRILEWLDSLFRSDPQPERVSGIGNLVYLLRILLIVGLIAVIGILAYKLIPLVSPKLKPRRKPKKRDRIILGEKIADDETAGDLLAEADRLAKAGNLRAAIRKGYIALLCELSDRKILGLARHKTNRDYLRDVRNRRDLHPRLKLITDSFERHWYGFQESDEDTWARFRDEYERAIRSA